MLGLTSFIISQLQWTLMCCCTSDRPVTPRASALTTSRSLSVMVNTNTDLVVVCLTLGAQFAWMDAPLTPWIVAAVRACMGRSSEERRLGGGGAQVWVA